MEGVTMENDWEKQIAIDIWEVLFDLVEHKKINRLEAKQTIIKHIMEAKSLGAAEERERIERNIGLLRQWLNERPTGSRLITNDDIKEFLLSNF